MRQTTVGPSSFGIIVLVEYLLSNPLLLLFQVNLAGIHENNFTTSFIVLDHVNLVISLPMLWGIPPTHRVLKPAIRTAGGVVEKVSHSWKLV